jgi:peptidoglycan hydrolase-like protein with peptidoglycan-binding domain
VPTTLRRTSTAFVAAILLALAGTVASTVLVVSAAQAAAQLGDRALHPGDKGADVKILQKDLNKVGIAVHSDGTYGSATKAAVVRFQRWAGLEATGLVGPTTIKALLKAISAGRNAATPSGGALGTDYTAPAPETPATTPFRKAKIKRGKAYAPSGAPAVVKRIIAAGNAIRNKPYIYGGGHGSFTASGYDCSGSVSYALHGGGLLHTQLTSGDLESWGRRGKGKWITINANAGHTFMYVAGLRFDTSGANPSRWQNAKRSASGYVVRHPAGL